MGAGKIVLIVLAVIVLMAFLFGVCGGRLSKQPSDARVPQRDLRIVPAPAPNQRKA